MAKTRHVLATYDGAMFFERLSPVLSVLYHFELQMAGVILLGTMLVCGVWLYIVRRRRSQMQDELDRQSGLEGWPSDDIQDNDVGYARGSADASDADVNGRDGDRDSSSRFSL